MDSLSLSWFCAACFTWISMFYFVCPLDLLVVRPLSLIKLRWFVTVWFLFLLSYNHRYNNLHLRIATTTKPSPWNHRSRELLLPVQPGAVTIKYSSIDFASSSDFNRLVHRSQLYVNYVCSISYNLTALLTPLNYHASNRSQPTWIITYD